VRRIAIGLLWGAPFYFVGLALGMWLVNEFSSNTHDRSFEAAVTGAFVTGPLTAVLAFIFGAVRAGSGKIPPVEPHRDSGGST
jgi:hypothetical protein